jgi:predicted metalloprotease with PDZ domain
MFVMTSMRYPIAIGVPAVCVTTQELPRRGAIGLVITVKNRSVVVQQVVAGGAGEAAGFRAEDWIRGVDGETITRPEQFTQAIGRHGGGDRVTVEIARAGARLSLAAVLKPRPLETSPNAEVRYQTVKVRDLRRRVICHPAAPRRPTACGPVDAGAGLLFRGRPRW